MHLKAGKMTFYKQGLFLLLVFLCLEHVAFAKEVLQKKEETEKRARHKGPEKKTVKKRKEKKTDKKENSTLEKPVSTQIKTPVSQDKTTKTAPPQEPNHDSYTHLPMLVKTNKKPSLGSTDANGRTIFEGPYGSRYFINKNGKKFYLKSSTKN